MPIFTRANFHGTVISVLQEVYLACACPHVYACTPGGAAIEDAKRIGPYLCQNFLTDLHEDKGSTARLQRKQCGLKRSATAKSQRKIVITPIVSLINPHAGKAPRRDRQIQRDHAARTFSRICAQARLHSEIAKEDERLRGETRSLRRHPASSASVRLPPAVRKSAASGEGSAERGDDAANAKPSDGRDAHIARVKRMRADAAIAAKKAAGDGDKQLKGSLAEKKMVPGPPMFDIRTVNRFDPGQSLSFARELFASFALSVRC